MIDARGSKPDIAVSLSITWDVNQICGLENREYVDAMM